jgi:hypothetical protein
MTDTNSGIEQKLGSAPRITVAQIEDNITSEHYFVASDAIQHENAVHVHREPGWTLGATQLLTLCVLQLRNGFVVTGESACASPANFNADLGRKYAREKAVEKMWALMGYELRSKLHKRALFDAEPKTGVGGEQ